MVPYEKFRSVLERLIERSRLDEVEWQAYEKSRTAFEVRLPTSLLRIQKLSPSIDPDYFRLQLFNNDGVPLVDVSVDESQTDNEWLPILAALYTEAFRCRTGWDKVLADLESAVGGKSHVGTPF